MLKKATALMAAFALVAGTAACNRGGGGVTADDVKDSNEEIPVTFSVNVDGDYDATVENRTVTSKVIVIRAEGTPLADEQVLAIEPLEPITEGDVRLLPGFSVIPFKGDGKYTIETGSPYDAPKEKGTEAKPSSGVRLLWWPSPTDAETLEYARRAKPCTVEVEDDGMKGRLSCPEMTGETPAAKHFSLDVRWEKA